MRVTVEHGQGTAIVGVGGVALVHGSTDLDVVGLLVDLVGRADAEMEALVDGLVALGVHDLPSFGVVLYGGTESRLMVRGTVAATATTDDGKQHRYDGIRVSTWVEDAAPIDGVILTIAGNEGPSGSYWLDSGVVPAGSIRWGVTADGPATEAGTEAVVPEAPEEPPLPEIDQVDGPPEEPIGAEPVSDPEPDLSSPEPPPTEPEGADDSGSEEKYDFTHLVDHTVFRSPGDAVVRLDEVDEQAVETPSPEPAHAEPAQPQVDDEPAPPMPTMPPDHTRPYSDMISEVPPDLLPVEPDPETPQPEAAASDVDSFEVPVGQLGDHDGHTVARRRRPIEPEPTVLADGPAEPGITLTGVLCSSGHGNNPISETCLTCGVQIVDHNPQQVQRPSLGLLQLPSGEAVRLTSPIVMGRSPVAVGLINGEVPQNIIIDDELISRNHAQIILEGWNVLISDLNSTNQTTIILPGQSPRVVPAEDSVLIVPGTEIYLGDHGPIVYETNS